MWPKLGKFARYFLLALSILGMLYIVNDLHNDLAPDWLGETNGNCDVRDDLPSVPNGNGMVATAHVTGCHGLLLSTALTTYVYVHKAVEKDSAKSLVFMFDVPSDDLQIVWSDNSNLHISISEVGDAIKQLNSMDGVKISYSIGKEVYSPEEIAREVRHDEEVSFVWLICWTAVCALTVRSIRKQKAKAA